METRSIRTLKRIGGRLCLDFANTRGMHASEQPREFLRTYFDLVEWSHYTGIISEDDVHRLLHEANNNPTESERVLHRAVQLRELMYRMFSSVAVKSPPKKEDLAIFNKNLSKMMALSKLELAESGFKWNVDGNKESLGWMLNSIIRSAFMLLTSNELNRVKMCADKRGCGWLFFDTSKNKSRRWCDMSDCGNKAKTTRYYHRKHKKGLK